MFAESASHQIPLSLWERFASEETNAFRIYSTSGGWVERLGENLLLSYKDENSLNPLLECARDVSSRASFHPKRIFGRYLPIKNQERSSPQLLEGYAGDELESTVLEAGVRFGVDFSTGYSSGLFLDQRINRASVKRNAGKRVLNTFAYTCSFSVCAALGGAETVSVDLSRKSLGRGEANFSLNGLDPAGHRFISGDVREVLPRLARRGEKFDTIILDPPTFSTSHSKGRFRVEDGMESLVLAVLEVANRGARILVSTNCTRLTHRDLEGMCRSALKVSRRTGIMQRLGAPEDFPAGEGATCVWLILS